MNKKLKFVFSTKEEKKELISQKNVILKKSWVFFVFFIVSKNKEHCKNLETIFSI